MLTMAERKKKKKKMPQDVYERMVTLDRTQRVERNDDGKEPFVVAGKSVALRSTPKALVVQIEKTRSLSSREVIIPYSCIHDDSEVYDMRDGREGKLVVHKWLGEKEGLPPAEK